MTADVGVRGTAKETPENPNSVKFSKGRIARQTKITQHCLSGFYEEKARITPCRGDYLKENNQRQALGFCVIQKGKGVKVM